MDALCENFGEGMPTTLLLPPLPRFVPSRRKEWFIALEDLPYCKTCQAIDSIDYVVCHRERFKTQKVTLLASPRISENEALTTTAILGP